MRPRRSRHVPPQQQEDRGQHAGPDSCGVDTQSIWPASRSFRSSPPCGSLASSRICAVEASTNSTPISASCTSGRLRSVQVSSSAPSSAATTAASCVPQPSAPEPERVRGDDAEARDLRDGQVDEHDPARQHLHAERHVRQHDQEPGDQRRQQDAEFVVQQAHFATPVSRFTRVVEQAEQIPGRGRAAYRYTAAARPARARARRASRPPSDRCRRCAGSSAAASRPSLLTSWPR